MPTQIRSATPADIPAIESLLQSVWQESWRPNTVSLALQSAGPLALVACQDQTIIGFACFHDVGFRAYLSEMIVHPNHQRSRVGTQLLHHAQSMLSQRNCHLVIADVYPPAATFYQKNKWSTPSAQLLAKTID